KDGLDTSGLLIGPGQTIAAGDAELPSFARRSGPSASCGLAIWMAADAIQNASSGLSRSVFSTACALSWQGASCLKVFGMSAPTACAGGERSRVVVPMCELRDAFRHFRTDRIGKVRAIDKRSPRRRQALLKDWHET